LKGRRSRAQIEIETCERRTARNAVRLSRTGGSGIAAGWDCGIVRVGAERSELGDRVGAANHGKGTGLVFAIEGRWVVRIEMARRKRGGILRIVEPEADMKRVRRRKFDVWIETEDLVEEDGLDANVAIIGALADFDVRLIPRQAKAASEGRILGAIGEERAVLNGEEIELQARLDAVEVQNQSVVELSADDGRFCARLLRRISAQAIDYGRIGNEIEGDFILLVLSGRDAGKSQSGQTAAGNLANRARIEQLREAISIQCRTPNL